MNCKDELFTNQVSFEDVLNDKKNDKYVRRILSKEARPFLLNIHYARRLPCITDAFGLFVNGEMIGVVTYGIPASHPLCIGIAGEKNQYNVKELNRLVILPKYNGGGTITQASLFPTL